MTTSAPTVDKPKRKRVWLRRLFKLFVAFVLLLVVARYVAQALLPDWLADAAREQGLECRYERLDISLTTLDIELWNLVVTELETQHPVLDVEYLRADVAVADLIRGDIVVHRAEIDGAVAHVHRFEDHWDWRSAQWGADGIASGAVVTADGAATDEAPPEEADAAPVSDGPISLEPPVVLRAARVQHVELHVHDHTADPTKPLIVHADVRISHVGEGSRDTKISASITSTPHIGIVRLGGLATSSAHSLDVSLDLDVIDLQPRTFHDELAALGFEPLTDSLGLHAGLHVALAQDDVGTVSGDVELNDVVLEADGAVAAQIDSVDVPCTALTKSRLELGDVALAGVTARAFTDPSGALVAGGFRFLPMPASEEPPEESSESNFAFALEHLAVTDLDAAFEMATTSPPTVFALDVKSLDVRHVALPLDDTRPNPTLALNAALTDLASELSLEGELDAAAGSANLALRGAGITPDALRVILRDAGLATTIENAQLSLSASAQWKTLADDALALDFALDDLAFVDGDGTVLAALNTARVNDLVLPGDDSRIDLSDVEIHGINATAWRSADGDWRGLGIVPLENAPPEPSVDTTPRVVPLYVQRMATPSAVVPPAAVADSKPATPQPARPFRMGRVIVDGPELTLVDNLRGRTIAIDTLRADVQEIVLGDGPPRVDRISLGLGATHIVRQLALDLAVTETGPTFAMQGSLTADGLSLNDLGDDLGLDTWLDNGRLEAVVSTSWHSDDDGFHIGGRIDDLLLADGPRELFAFDALALEDATFGDALHIPSLTWDRPRAAITKRDDGRFDLLGVTVGGETNSAPEIAAPNTPLEPAAATKAEASAGGLVDLVAITGAGLDWTDPSGSSRIDFDLRGNDLAWGASGRPGTLALSLAIPEALDEFRVEGAIDTSPAALTAAITLRGRGMRAGPLARYLPEGVAVTWDDASLDGGIEALWAAHDAGGHRVQLAITDLHLADTSREYLTLPELRLDAARLDIEQRRYDVQDLRLRGLRTGAARDVDGNLDVLGVVLSAAPAEDAPATPTDDAASARERVRSALRDRFLDRAALGQALDIDITTFDLQIEHAEFDDAAADEPIVIRDLHLRSSEPITLPERPVHVVLDASISPFVEHITLDTKLEANESPGQLDVTLEARGLRTPGSESTRALRGAVDLDWSTSSSSPLQFDPTRPLTLDASITNLGLSETPDSELLFGFEEFLVDTLRYQPARNLLTINALVLEGPTADVTRTAEGYDVAGIFIPSPKEDPADAPDDTTSADAPAAAEPEPDVTVDEDALAIRIGSAIVTGVEAIYEDLTTTPVTLFPIDDLDLEVRSIDLDRLPFGHVLPFSLFVRGGVVPPGTLRPSDTEEKRVLGGLDVSGRLGIQPTLDGVVDVDVYQLELPALAGIANEAGVSLKNGVFDLDARYTFRADGSLDARNALEFSDLSLSEPDGGALSNLLLLSLPIQAVVAILRDEVGVIDLDVNFSSGRDGLSLGEIARLATATLSRQLTRAIANAPFRVLNFGADMAGQVGNVTGVSGLLDNATNLIGIGDFGDDVPVALELTFAPGVIEPAGRFGETIATWSDLMAEDETLLITLTHEIGTQDVARMTDRLDPSQDTIEASVDELRGRRTALIAKRGDLLMRARAAHAVNPGAGTDPAVVRLTRVNEELGLVERALDATLELLGPAGKRRAELRIGKGCIELASARLEALRQRILDNERVKNALVNIFERRSARGWASRIRVQRPRHEPNDDLPTSRIVVALERRG